MKKNSNGISVLKPRMKFKYVRVVEKLEAAFSIGATVAEACTYADIARDTYYRWIKKNPILKERFESLLEKPILQARQTVVSALKDNPEIALKYLERKRKDEFSLRSELTGKNGNPIEQKIDNKIEVTFKDFSKNGNSTK